MCHANWWYVLIHGIDCLPCFLISELGGKSLTYQLPAIMGNGCTIVISPLVALMLDQIKQLQDLNSMSSNTNI